MVQLLKDHPLVFDVLRWSLIVLLVVLLYSYIAIKLWQWFLNLHDHRSSYQKWLDQKEDDEEQMEYLREQERKRKEKRRK